MSVGDYCERPARAIGPEESLRQAARRMDEHAIGSRVLEVDNEPQGVITDRDLVLEVLCNDLDPSAVTIGELKHDLVITVRDDMTLADPGCSEMAEAMRDRAVGSLGVLQMGQPVGTAELKDVSDAALRGFMGAHCGAELRERLQERESD